MGKICEKEATFTILAMEYLDPRVGNVHALKETCFKSEI